MAKITKWNVFYTVLIFINNFAFGLNATLFGAIMVDLRVIYAVSINTMSYITIPSSIGYLTGSLASFLYRWINRQLALSFFLFLMGSLTFIVPFLGNIWLLFLDCLVTGVGTGGYDSGYSIWLVELWPDHNAAVLQAALFVSGIGSIVGPLLGVPFVHGEVNGTRNGTLGLVMNDLSVEKRKWDIAIPLSIAGGALCISPTIFVILFFLHRYKEPTKPNLETNPTDSNNNPPKPNECSSSPDPALIPNRHIKLFIMALAVSFYICAEQGYLFFSDTIWQYLEIGLSAQEAAFVLSILTATYTAGRLITAFISLKIKPDYFISYHYLIIIFSLTLLYFGRHNIRLIYTGNALLGFGYSAMWPGFFAFTQNHLRLTDKICSLFSFMSAVFGLVLPAILGQTLESFPMIIFIVEGVFIAGSLILFCGVRAWIWWDSKNDVINVKL